MKTSLYDWHLSQGAKMVSFAGYDMPVQYPDGVLKEHLHTRQGAGLFDVSHMGQVQLRGENVAQALEKLVPGDIQALAENTQRYSMFTNAQGGVLDDLMILNRGNCLHLVVNAACKAEDIAYLKAQLPAIDVTELKDHALLALQGPRAFEVLQADVPDIQTLAFMQALDVEINGIECLITRSGYTGEDGFEISCAADQAPQLADYLCQHEAVKPIGLGARDSLRLEAGLCLYGHDLDTQTTPVEANLNWVISPSRREGERANFVGAELILKQLAHGAPRKRVGLAIDGRAPVREGVQIVNAQGEQVGVVCSGGFSPSLQKPIAMAYVNASDAALDTELFAQVRKKSLAVKVCKLPFVPASYYKV